MLLVERFEHSPSKELLDKVEPPRWELTSFMTSEMLFLPSESRVLGDQMSGILLIWSGSKVIVD